MNFSNFPYEIRRQIWVATIEPRTLTITCFSHQGPEPAIFCHNDDPAKEHGWGVLKARNGIEVRPSYDQGQLSQTDFIREVTRKAPAGPVALQACSESREIALERYQLAFGGTAYCSGHLGFTKEWMGRGLGQKRVWVDFKQDTILVRGGTMMRSVLSRWVLDDAMKIRTMALYYGKNTVRNAISRNTNTAARASWYENYNTILGVLKNIHHYWSLETLIIYYDEVAEGELHSLRVAVIKAMCAPALNQLRRRLGRGHLPLPDIRYQKLQMKV